MPEWLQLLVNTVSIIGIGVVVKWIFDLGKAMGRFRERLDAQDEKIKVLAGQIADCPPRAECAIIFRQISHDIGELNGKMDFVVNHVKKSD